jgi:hypothetical protein
MEYDNETKTLDVRKNEMNVVLVKGLIFEGSVDKDCREVLS